MCESILPVQLRCMGSCKPPLVGSIGKVLEIITFLVHLGLIMEILDCCDDLS